MWKTRAKVSSTTITKIQDLQSRSPNDVGCADQKMPRQRFRNKLLIFRVVAPARRCARKEESSPPLPSLDPPIGSKNHGPGPLIWEGGVEGHESGCKPLLLFSLRYLQMIVANCNVFDISYLGSFALHGGTLAGSCCPTLRAIRCIQQLSLSLTLSVFWMYNC